MAENIRSIKEIMDELFKDAIPKYSKVRHTQYELNLWVCFGLPLSEVDRAAKAYFSKRFLDGQRIDKASEKTIRDGFKRLDHAVNDGCKVRCHKLVRELNSALAEYGIKPVEVDVFLDWLTFDGKAKRGFDGELIEDKPYGFPIIIFDDARNLKEFWAEAQALLKAGRIASMHDIATLVIWKRKHSVFIE